MTSWLLTRRWAALLVPLILILAGSFACSGSAVDREIVVLGPWLDETDSATDERDVFTSVLRAYAEEHDLTITYQGTRAIGQALRAKVRNGTLPDIAIMPNVGELAGYATTDLARPVTDLVDSAANASGGSGVDHRALWQDGRAYAVAIKTDLKSMVMFDPARGSPTATTWNDLLEVSRTTAAGKGRIQPWCLGMSAPSAPGWPGTDWIEDMLLHSAGAQFYESWASGDESWESSQVKEVWRAWNPIVQAWARGGPNGALLTTPAQAAEALAANQCALLHQSSVFAAGRDLDFFAFPVSGAGRPTDVEVSGDFAALFTDNPAAKRLLEHLADVETGGNAWVRASKGSVYPLNVDPASPEYGALNKRVARALTDAKSRCLDASDAMPATMAAAFHNAVLEYLAYPARLDAILSRLDEVRLNPAREPWLKVRCSP